MHKRSFLMGIGLGIIIGVLLLELFQLGEKGQQQLTQIEQQINEGVTPSPSPVTQPELEQDNSEEMEEAADEAKGEEPEPPASPASPDAPEVNEASEVPEPTAVVEPKLSYILRVHYGDPIKKTGQQLAEHGVIDDVDEFISYFQTHDSKIRAGFFYVEEQSELEDLHKLFTDQPLTESEANEQIATKGLKLIQ